MAELKLGKLPERIPLKLSISISPDLGSALAFYAELYERQYGSRESIADLIPAMLDAFLASDRAYLKARRAPPDNQTIG